MVYNSRNGKVVIDGFLMNYVSFGYGKKVLILLPGLSDGLVTVKGKALFLACSYKRFLKDYKVYIFSRKNDLKDNCSIESMAEDQAKAMKAIGIKKASILGVSEGGMIAEALAINNPELIDKLILAVTTSRIDFNTYSIVKTWIDYAKDNKYKELMIDTINKSYTAKYIKRYKIILPIIYSVRKPRDYNRFLVNANAILEFDCHNKLSKINAPTFIIGGKEDKIVGIDASYEMHKLIKNSKLYVYDNLGHALYEETKKDFEKRVLEFLLNETIE